MTNKSKYDQEFAPINDMPENIARTLFNKFAESTEQSQSKPKGWRGVVIISTTSLPNGRAGY